MFENIPKIGERVKFFRMLNGYSQTNLGKAIGKGSDYIVRFENGHCPPNPSVILKLCEVFNISMKEFFDLDIDYIQNSGFFDKLHKINNVKKRKDTAVERFDKLCKENPFLTIYF